FGGSPAMVRERKRPITNKFAPAWNPLMSSTFSFAGSSRVVVVLLAVSCAPARAAEPVVDLSRGVVVTPSRLSVAEKKAVALLCDEVEKRTQIRWPVSESWPTEAVPVVAVGRDEALKGYDHHFPQAPGEDKPKAGAEGYRIVSGTSGGVPVVRVAGNDARGVLYGVGRLLRSLVMEKRK